MTFPFKYLLVFSALLVLPGCATLDKDDCLSANWHDIGHKDGSKGYKSERYLKHNEACQEHNVRVNTADYRNGWNEGIEEFCTEDNGWRVGLEGKTYHKSCPKRLKLEFYNAYQLGRDVYEKEQNLEKINKKLERVVDKLADDDTSSDRRKSLRKERSKLKSERSTAENDLESAVQEARDMGFYSH